MQADYVIDRRRLRRKLILWRVFAVLAAAIAILAIAAASLGRGALPGEDHVARITIDGVITGDRPLLKLFDDAAKANNVKAVILDIDSPGGTVTGSEAIYDAIRIIAAKKPTVAVIDSVGASGGYIAALGADRIYARSSAIVGSIGVIAQYPNVSKLLATLGVEVESVRSSPLKASPSGFEPTPPEARAALEALIRDNFDWFRTLVRDRRKLTEGELAGIADGRVFTGRQAVPLKLIDATGTETDAITWLETEKKLTKGLPVRQWKRAPPDGPFGVFGAAAALAEQLDWPLLSTMLRQGEQLESAAKLDGILFLWRPFVE
jgi:protease IV